MKHGRSVGMIALAGLFVVARLVSIRAGPVSLGLGAVWDALLGRGGLSTVTIVRDLRLPRAAAAPSGARFQPLLRNPLAGPYVWGSAGGAALGAVAARVFGVLLPVPAA